MPPPFHIHVTPGDEAPIYRQIVRQVVEAVAAGSVAPGARLPSLRELGAKLVVAPLTVKKAYDVLEARGLIESRRGQGTFVRIDAARSKQASSQRLQPLVRRLLIEADLGGVEPEALGTLIEEEREALRRERENRGEAS